MFDYYEKLFQENLRYTPYNNNNEYVWDQIKFLDMRLYDLVLDINDEREEDEKNKIKSLLLQWENIKCKTEHNSEKKERIRILEFIEEYIKDREEVSQFSNKNFELMQIERAFNMNKFMKTCLIMSLSYELNKKYAAIYSYINKNKNMIYPIPDIAFQICNIFPEAYNKVISNMGNLKAIKEYLFEDNDQILLDSKNDIVKPLKLNKRIQKLLFKSENVTYEDIPYLYMFNHNKDLLEAMDFNHHIQENIEKICFQLNSDILYNSYDKATIIFIKGQEGVGKKFSIKHTMKKLNRKVLFIDVSVFITEKDNFLNLKREILRECLIENAIPCFNNLHILNQTEKEAAHILRTILFELKSITNLIFITSEELYDIPVSDNIDIIKIIIENPTRKIRTEYWRKCLEDKKISFNADINVIVNKFSFTPGQIKLVVNQMFNKVCLSNNEEITEEEAYEICNNFAFNKLSNLATLIKPSYIWADLVLKKEQKDILMQACNHIKYKHIVYEEWDFNQKRSYGNGVCILFTGEPGTGKTMAAQVTASNLNLNVYKVDLSAITSKYIGETEKNIKKLFDEAKKSNSVLFFDEADTIFGKRTEVKDSHDKYANMDAAYLLQKMEEYEGISILATNYMGNIDNAFIRRISFIIRFSMPEINERREIWKKSFPKNIPIDREIDFEFLASQFELSGSNIKNVALHSAFLAASNNEGLSMKHIINALKIEYLKINKILLKEDFGPYFNE